MNITTPRLVLREFVAEDWHAVLAYQNDPRYLSFSPWEARTKQDAQAFVQMFLKQQKETPRTQFHLGIVLPTTGQLIGNCGIRVNDLERGEANIGYELDAHFWGHGYATEAAHALLTFGFETLKMRRIWAECLTDNRASGRVLEKVGMQQQLDFYGREFFKNRWWMISQYAILEHEWLCQTSAKHS